MPRTAAAGSQDLSSPARSFVGLLVSAARDKDLPVLSAGVLVIGVVYMIATLAADILISILNPRVRLGDES